MYDEQTCESNEIIDENINATARNTNVIEKKQELSNIDNKCDKTTKNVKTDKLLISPLMIMILQQKNNE